MEDKREQPAAAGEGDYLMAQKTNNVVLKM